MSKNKKIVSGKQPVRQVVKTKEGQKLVIPHKPSRLFPPAASTDRPKRGRYRSGKRTGDKR
jgi:hypothetical protein